MKKILVIDDEKNILQVIDAALKKEKLQVRCFESAADAIIQLPMFHPDLVITDIRMNEMNGFDVLRAVKEFDHDINVILITAYASVESAISALRAGAFDYLMKPFKIEELRLIVKRALSLKRIETYKTHKAGIEREMIMFGQKMQDVMTLIKKVSKTDCTVLVCGESGTGKELVARAIYCNSLRKHKPFVSVNCAALPETLLESELFGHEKGSFTGAVETKIGLFEYADGGTIFLDEVGETSLNIQVKLLRALQEKEIKRIGGVRDIKIDVRVISATSRRLEVEVAEKRFRDDLYYRLNVVPIVVPPLRERKGDLPKLIDHFLALSNEKLDKTVSFEPNVITYLTRYDWPGNVRELENTIERLVTLCEATVLTEESVKEYLKKDLSVSTQKIASASSFKEEAEEKEKSLILKVLEETNGNKMKAAKKLNISRQSLHYKLKKYGIAKSSL